MLDESIIVDTIPKQSKKRKALPTFDVHPYIVSPLNMRTSVGNDRTFMIDDGSLPQMNLDKRAPLIRTLLQKYGNIYIQRIVGRKGIGLNI